MKDLIENMIDYYRSVRWYFKTFFERIRRIISYIPILWNMYDWDYSYAINIFTFQLERIAKNIEDNDKYLTSKSKAQRIRTITKLMKKVYDDEYSMEYYDIMEKKYGKAAMNISFEPIDKENSGQQLYEMKREWDSYDNSEEIEKEYKRLFNLSQEKQKKAENLVWKLIEHNIRNFWD